MRKFRRTAKTAEFSIELRFTIAPGGSQWRVIKQRIRSGGRRHKIGERGGQRGILRAHFRVAIAVVLRHSMQQIRERRHAVARRFRKISAAKEGPLIVVGQKHSERPTTTTLGQHLMRELVNFVDVRPLFTVYLDVDEQLIHQLCRRCVFE